MAGLLGIVIDNPAPPRAVAADLPPVEPPSTAAVALPPTEVVPTAPPPKRSFWKRIFGRDRSQSDDNRKR
jgi:hypothetical protein